MRSLEWTLMVLVLIQGCYAAPMEQTSSKRVGFSSWMQSSGLFPVRTDSLPAAVRKSKSKKNLPKEATVIPKDEPNKNKKASSLNLRKKKSVHKLTVWEDHEEEHEAAITGVSVRKQDYFGHIQDYVISSYIVSELNFRDASHFALVSKRIHQMEKFPFCQVKSIKHLMSMVENNQLKPYLVARLRMHIEQAPFLKVSREASDAMLQMEAKKGWNKEFLGRIGLIMDHRKRRKDAKIRRTLSDKWLGLAAKYNNTELFKMLSSSPKVLRLNEGTLMHAIAEKDLDMFLFLLGKFPASELNREFVHRMFNAAVGNAGSYEITRYLHDRFQVIPNEMHMNAAVQTGNAELVRYLSERFQLRPGYDTLKGAAKSGKFDVYKYVSDRAPADIEADEDILNEAVKRGSLQLVKYLVEDKLVDPSGDTVECASENSNRSIAKYIREFVNYVHDRIQSAIREAKRISRGRRLTESSPGMADNTFSILNENN